LSVPGSTIAPRHAQNLRKAAAGRCGPRHRSISFLARVPPRLA